MFKTYKTLTAKQFKAFKTAARKAYVIAFAADKQADGSFKVFAYSDSAAAVLNATN